MSSDELRDAIAGALYVRDRFDSPTVVLADAILALPEMQAMLAEIERLRAKVERQVANTMLCLVDIERLAADNERLRAAANRTLNAFFCCEGLDNTHLMDAFSEWAVLMNPEAFPEAVAWVAKFKARHD